jgi:two-component system phosphate regulon response regulator PhoB
MPTQAQAQVDRVLPDLVLLDWMLPGQSGLQLAPSAGARRAHARAADHHAHRRADEADKITAWTPAPTTT